jgi:hypothetical protein
LFSASSGWRVAVLTAGRRNVFALAIVFRAAAISSSLRSDDGAECLLFVPVLHLDAASRRLTAFDLARDLDRFRFAFPEFLWISVCI